jgi:putative ABC transport system permease protein
MWIMAVKALLGDRARLLSCLIGVAFSVVLINLQGGLLLGLIKKASMLIDYGQADIWVGHRHMNNIDVVGFIPERWVHRIRSVEGIERVEPYIVNFGVAAMPDGRLENVVVVGCEPSSLLGNAWKMAEGDARAIRQSDGILVDVSDVAKWGNCRIGDTREINGKRARVVGMTKNIVGFTTQPYVFTTINRARTKYSSMAMQPGQCSFFLVTAHPGVELADLCRRIQERIPELDVRDRQTWGLMCMEYWLLRTGIGISFGLATLLGLIVGLGIVTHTLYASVRERSKEFGTLKALGADDPYIARFLWAQALSSALGGSVLGLAAAGMLAWLIHSPRAPVVLTFQLSVFSVVVVTIVCFAASWLPYWKIKRIDPASVLRT